MLAADALTDALAVYRLLSILNDKLATGRADDVDDVRETLAELCHRLEPELPIIRGIIAAHRQAAQAVQLAQRPAGGQPAPYPYPANDTHSVTPTAPSLA
jgi:hypothetical protein